MPLEIYQKEGAEAKYWANFWKEREKSLDEQQQYMEFNFLAEIFRKYISHRKRILEGGCGTGRWVFYLKEMGYDIIGVEWSKEVVDQVKVWDPNVPIIVGDIFNLDFPDSFFQTYISLGVIEHHENYSMALKEAYRVICNGGFLLCTVPYFNPIRRIKNIFGAYKAKVGETFFEYRFTKKEIIMHVKDAGFEIIEVDPFSVPYGLKLDIPGMPALHKFASARYRNEWFDQGNIIADSQTKKIKIKTMFIRALKHIMETSIMRCIFGHMILIVAKKNEISR